MTARLSVFILGFFVGCLLLLLPEIVSICQASDKPVFITEIMYDPEGSDSGASDWIELYNAGTETITLAKEAFGLIDEAEINLGKDGTHYLNCHSLKESLTLMPREYLILAENEEKFAAHYPSISSDLVVDTTFSLSSDGDTIRLSDDKCATFFLTLAYDDSWGAKNNGQTLEKIIPKGEDAPDNWQESYDFGGTPSATSSLPKEYPSGVRINEILPRPADGQYEYIELFNTTDEKIDLGFYLLRDASKTGRYKFPAKKTITAHDYTTLKYKEDFNFKLNDSGEETLTLYDPNGKELDRIEYSSAKEGIAFGFDGSLWRWSRHRTPDKKNKFDPAPKIKIEKDDNIYQNMYAEFKAETNAKGKDIKYTWDFGDDHKSYKQETRHKYERTGTYQASLKVRTPVEDLYKFFTLRVGKYPQRDIKIVSLSPNPKGRDTDSEWIAIKNNSKKKIDLRGWSIATGWKKLINHPIRRGFVLKAGETKKLTRHHAAFSLNNTKNKIELRYPNGQAAQKISYDRKKNKIVEEEIYELVEKDWSWNTSAVVVKAKKTLPAPQAQAQGVADEPLAILISEEELRQSLGRSSTNTEWENRRQGALRFILSLPRISLTALTQTAREGIMLKNGQVWLYGNRYLFTQPDIQQHWLEKVGQNLNGFLNRLLRRPKKAIPVSV